MTQKQLADELSVTYKAVSKWETGAGLPDIAMLPALASTLKVSVDEIVSGSSSNDYKKDDENNLHSRLKAVRRYIRKPAVIVMTSLIFTLIALVIIFNNFKTNKDSGYDESIHVNASTASGFGITADHAKEIYDAQLAVNIRTQLLQSFHIEDAVVLICTAEANPFRIQENKSETMVSVILTIADTYTLSDIDIQAIEILIRSAVPDVKDENISIT